MSELYVVPFNDNDYHGRYSGDSGFSPATNFPYKEGMTVKDLLNPTLRAATFFIKNR